MSKELNKTISPSEFARELGYSMNYTYGLIATDKVAATKRDGRWLISAGEVEKRRRMGRTGVKNVGK
jgi:hypothetical protein